MGHGGTGGTEVFIESDFESLQSARQTRDLRLAQLLAEGYACESTSLQTVETGRWVFVLHFEIPSVEPAPAKEEVASARPKLKLKKYQVQ